MEIEKASGLSLTTPISRTIAEQAKELITPTYNEVMGEHPNLDAFLMETRLNTLESVNEKLRKDLNREQNERLDDKEGFLKIIKKLNTELQDYEIECRHLVDKNEKALKEVKRSLEATTNELDATKKDLRATLRDLDATKKDFKATLRDLDATSRDLDEEILLHKEYKKALSEEKHLVYQNEQEITQLQLKIAKLKETFMESMIELRELRGSQHSMVGMHQHPHPFPNQEAPRMDLSYKEHHTSKRKAIDEPEPEPEPEPKFQKQLSTKYKAIDKDSRENKRNKRICYSGNKCTYLFCDFAHSMADLVICRYGINCNFKLSCGYMIHSEEERNYMVDFVESRGINVALCKDYDKLKSCVNGKCNSIHKIYYQ